MSTWIYQGKPFTQDDVPPDAVGFVYCITNTITGLKYIGKKNLWRVVVKPPLKGYKRKRRSTVPSDWMNYTSSSRVVQEEIEAYGLGNYTREILCFANSKGMLSYLEAKTQFDLNVLLDDSYLNGIINCRINRTHLK